MSTTTCHENQYDPQLEWVIEEVIHAITNKQCTESIWYEVFENIYQTTADDAWDEYQLQQRLEAEGEALFQKEQDDENLSTL